MKEYLFVLMKLGFFMTHFQTSKSVNLLLLLLPPPALLLLLRALKSNVDLHLLNGLPPLSRLFDLPFQFVILHLLLSFCVQFHIPSCCPHLINPFPLSKFIPLSLTAPRPRFFSP